MEQKIDYKAKIKEKINPNKNVLAVVDDKNFFQQHLSETLIKKRPSRGQLQGQPGVRI